MTNWRILMLGLVGALGAACSDDGGGYGGSPTAQGRLDGGSEADAAGPSGPFIITIADFTFAPANLQVVPGATVTVRNMDDTPHSVTSQTQADDFAPGAVAGVSFDTGVFSRGERTFTVSVDAPPGTVIPYFCTVHRNAMKNDGRITVR